MKNFWNIDIICKSKCKSCVAFTFANSMVKYALAPDEDERLGGELAHIVVMQHVKKDHLQLFLDDLKQAQ